MWERKKKRRKKKKSHKKRKKWTAAKWLTYTRIIICRLRAQSPEETKKNNFTIWIYFSFTEREREKLLLLSFRKKITLGVGKLIAYYVHMAWLSLVRVRSLLLDLTTFTSCSWDSFFSLLVRPWTVKHKLGKWQPNGGRVLNPSSEPGRKIESKLFGLPHTLARMNQSHVALDEKITKPKWDKRHFFFFKEEKTLNFCISRERDF